MPVGSRIPVIFVNFFVKITTFHQVNIKSKPKTIYFTHVFINFTIEALAEVLHKSQMTVKTALAVLEKQELIWKI